MFLSHSGNTAECVQVAEILRKREIFVSAIVGKDGNGDIYVIVVIVIVVIVIVADCCYCCDWYCCYCYLNLF